jgi:uncharacterized protein (DUF1330 family)
MNLVRLMMIATAFSAGFASIPATSAQSPTPVYVVNEIDVRDAPAFQDYSARQGKLVESYGGKFLVRGGTITDIAGTPPKRVAVYVFESMSKMQAWQNAPEQKELSVIRDKASTFRSFAVEACAECVAFNK